MAGLVTPGLGLLGRTLEVTIAGQDLGFTAATPPTFDFGSNIMVSQVQVVDPDSAIATVQISAMAATGPRNVSFMAGGATLTATGAFDVEPPLDVSLTQVMGMQVGPAPEQGGLAAVSIHNVDTANALDTNVLYETAGSTLLEALDQTSTDISAAILFAPLSPTGATQVELANPALDGSAALTYVSAANALTVGARTAVAITSGTAKNDSLPGPFTTNLYKLSTTGAVLVSLNTTSADTDPIAPRMRVYGNDGLPDTLLDDEGGPGLFGNTPAADLFPLTATASTYVVLFDGNFGGGPSGYSYSLTPTVTAVANVIAAPTTAHGTPATAPDETTKCVPGPCIITGSITSAAQTDAYALTLTATANVTISLNRAQQTGAIAVIAPAMGTSFDYSNMEVDNSELAPTQPVNVGSTTSNPGTAGTWYVIVLDEGSAVGGTTLGDYSLSIQTM